MPQIAPAQPITVIGDVHGRADLLTKALAHAQTQVVLVGDLIDRGEDSAEVMRMVHGGPDLVCLMGNHEDMMINFIQDPERHGPRWLRYGGLQTLASFNVTGMSETTTGKALVPIRDALVQAMGSDLLNWLMHLPSSWITGNIAVTHAGANPAKPIEEQSKNTFRWGHPDFETTPRQDGMWVVHGHTITPEAYSTNGRINVDTGAYATGRLTAAHISTGDIRFESFTPG